MRTTIAFVVVMIAVAPLGAQQEGDRVQLASSNTAGVPVHPAASNNSYVRWANGTLGIVTDFDVVSGWFEIEADDGSMGWVTNRYITVLVSTDADFDDTADPDGTPILTRIIGAWNLEHFAFGRSRGFPENTRGGPTYSSRTDAEIQEIASAIRDDLGAAIMVLSEVNGDGQHDSPEMDRLVSDLGGSWNYFIGTTGGNQRVAVLWDENQVVRNTCDEFTFADHDVQNKDIFDRDLQPEPLDSPVDSST